MAGLFGSAIKGQLSPLTAALNIAGGNGAAGALKTANTQARTDLNTGYDKASGFQQPIYDKALKTYSDLGDKYAAGGFSNPHMDAFKFDPNSVFQDPEYQAQMKAGTEAVNRNAFTKGNLFSGTNDRDLEKFGQDTFAGRSDALYKRGFDASKTAFDQNNTTNLNNFNEGHLLTQPLSGAAGQLTSLGVGQGEDMASLDQERGMIRAGNIGNTYGQIVGGINQYGDALGGALDGNLDPNSLGQLGSYGSMRPRMQSLSGSMFTPRSALA